MAEYQNSRLSMLLCGTSLALSLGSLASFYLRRRSVIDSARLAPDVEYLLARAQALQQSHGDAVLTADHLASIMDGVGAAGGSSGKGDQLTKEQLEDTMKQMLQGPGAGLADGQTALEKFTNDLTLAARQQKLDPLIGRDAEMRRAVHILLRRTKNNPVLVGEPGVGKTAIAEGLAQRIVAGDVPVGLLGAQLLELDLPSLAAGCMMPGEFEERLKMVIQEITESRRRIVLFIDDLHNLVPSAASQGASMIDGSAVLKPALSRGTLRCIGASTLDKFKKTIEKDPGLERCFQQVMVEPTSIPDTISILRGLRPRYEGYHGISISEGALMAAATLSQRYISGRHLPDKAIDCLDEAAAQVKMEAASALERLDVLDRQIKGLEVEERDLARRTGETIHPTASTSSSNGLYHGLNGAVGGGVSALSSSPLRRGSSEGGAKDGVAAGALLEIRGKLEALRSERAAMGSEVAAEQEEATQRLALRAEAARCRYEADMLRRRAEDPQQLSTEEAEALEAADAAAAEAEAAYQRAEKAAAASAAGGKRLTRVSKDEVNEQDVARVISKWTGIPIAKLVSTERDRLLQLGAELHKRIIGQTDAVAAVATAIQRSRADLGDPNGPIASFMFLGPTGVGKTELAKTLAAFLFNTEEAMVRLDMSEYMEKHSVSRLIGCPPGYVGYEEGGLLTDAVRRRPYSVVLMDEVEKAHADVFNVLLQILDDGRVTDSQGRTVSFKNCLIIMTSNLGSAEIFQHLPSDSKSALKTRVMDQVRSHFRPEFINRVDEFIVFEPLVQEQIRAIVGLRAAALVARVAKQRITLQLTESALDFLANKGFDPVYGARPVKRALQRELQTRLAQALLRSEFVEGDVIVVQAAADGSGLILAKAGDENGLPAANGVGNGVGSMTRSSSTASSSGLPAVSEAGEASSGQQGAPPAAAKRGPRKIVIRGVQRPGAGSNKTESGVNGHTNGVTNGATDA